jgi:hypothetical protein
MTEVENMNGEQIREIVGEAPAVRLLVTLATLCAVLPRLGLAMLLYPLRARRARIDRRRLRTANMVLRITNSNGIKYLK